MRIRDSGADRVACSRQAVLITVVLQIQETNMLSHDCNKCDRGMRLASQSNKTVGRIVPGTLADVELLDRMVPWRELFCGNRQAVSRSTLESSTCTGL